MLNKERVRQICEGMIKGVDADIKTFDFDAYYDNEISPSENLEILKEDIAKTYPRTLTLSVTELAGDYKALEEKEKFEKNSLKDYLETKEIITKLFNKPRVIGIVGDVSSGKSNFIYSLITELKKEYKFNLYTYGLKFNLGEDKIYSVEELETIKNSIIIIDEFVSLWDISDRKKRKLIEKSLRLISHNNNILVLVGLPENFVKYISSRCDMIIYFKCTIADFINGSRAKNVCLSYRGSELGSSMLDLNKDECILYDWNYSKIKVSYLDEFDSKKNNRPIICAKNVQKNKFKGEMEDDSER